MPMDVCMWFGPAADYMVERIGGRRVAKALLDRCETAGLIHMSRNTTAEIEFLIEDLQMQSPPMPRQERSQMKEKPLS